METKSPANRLKFWLAQVPDQDIHFNAGSKEAPNLKEGKARLVVEAQSNDFRGATDTHLNRRRRRAAPALGFGRRLSALHQSRRLGDGAVDAVGLLDRSRRARGQGHVSELPHRRKYASGWRCSPIPGTRRSTRRRWSSRRIRRARKRRRASGSRYFPKKFRMRDLAIDDKFLDKVVNQIDPGGSGDLLTRFLKINGEMRRANNKTLADLRFKTAEKFLWTEPFLQLANSKVESEFADVRSYIYKGKKVDQQVHLGFDLAVTAHTPVVASNDGKVVWAAPLGIYGNCIVVDHGYGLQSIYGHLSSIAVKEGDMVKRGQEMGKSGSTGLAGGDHLHFSMQVEGVEVNPVEWWDAHWIKDHVQDRLKR